MRRFTTANTGLVVLLGSILLLALVFSRAGTGGGQTEGHMSPVPAAGSRTATVARGPSVGSSPSPWPQASLQTPIVAPTATPESTEFQLSHSIPPERDLYDLTRRLKPGAAQVISPTAVPTPPDFQVGHREVFWLADLGNSSRFTATATLQLRTEHAYFFVADGTEIGKSEIERAGQEFEDRIFPEVTGYFGDQWAPSPVNGDARLTIVITRTPGAGGYFSSTDEYPKAINPYSNERSIIYLNGTSVNLGINVFGALLTHEFTHALHWQIDSHEQTWVSEGCAELAADLTGFGASSSAFLNSPDTQLNAWSESRDDASKHYGASYLFMKYFAEHYGGYNALKDFMATPGHAERKFDAYLSSRGFGADFDDVFNDWVVANLLDLPGEGRFGYPDAEVQVKALDRITTLGRVKGEVHQYGTRYYDLQPPASSFRLRFAGNAEVNLLSDEAHSGRYQWWSNRADNMDSTLTRSFDLRGLDSATLRFWTWYDVEKDWDHVYVEASADGGRTWTILPGTRTTTEDPLGNSFGPAYTGKSGDGRESIWVEETVDLSSFAGKEILIRFEYVTDESTSLSGVAIDDIAIPELGYRDDAESSDGWQANGFIRVDNTLPQHFSVRLVEFGRQVSVEDLPLDALQSGEVEVQGLGQDINRIVLVVSGLAPATTEPAQFELTLSPL